MTDTDRSPCVACDQPIIAGALVCEHCGARQSDARARERLRICTACRSRYSAGARAGSSGPSGLFLLLGPLAALFSRRGKSDACPRCGGAGVPLDTPTGRDLAGR